jgi:hypothetical protein
MSNKNVVINFVGAPSSGKSLMSALLYSELKINHLKAEYVQEYAKKLIYEGRFEELNNQYNVSMAQYNTLKAVSNNVDYCITDSPILLGIYYNRVYDTNICNIEKVENIFVEKMNEFKNIYIYLKRNSEYPFEKQGRVHNEDQSSIIEQDLEKLLIEFKLPYKKFISDKASLQDIIDYINSIII